MLKTASYHLFSMEKMTEEAPLCFLSRTSEQKEVKLMLKKYLQIFYLKTLMILLNI